MPSNHFHFTKKDVFCSKVKEIVFTLHNSLQSIEIDNAVGFISIVSSRLGLDEVKIA